MPLIAKGFTNQEPFSPDNLFAGDFPRADKKVTVALSAALVRGAVLGRVTAGGKYLLSLSAAIDGSQVPEAILAEDADASAADAEALIYMTGEFNEAALTIGAAHTADSIREGLRDKSIFLKKTQAAAA